MLAEGTRPGITLFHLGSRRACRRNQGRPQGNPQVEFLLRPRRGLGEGGQQRQAPREMLHSFQVGRALAGALTRLMPIANRLGSVAKFDFWGKIQKLGIRNSMTYRLPKSRKSNFATEPTAAQEAPSYPGLIAGRVSR